MPAKEPEKDPLEGNLKYRKVEFLNAGSFGYVVKAIELQTGQTVAIKFVEIQ